MKKIVTMSRFSKYILVLCVFAVASCRSQVTSFDNTCFNIEAALDNCADVPLSRYVSDIEYIPLETNEKSLVVFTFDMSTDGKYLYFYCYSNTQQVLVFDMNGKYISQINKKGRGPGEYEGLSDFSLESDLNGQHVCLFESFANKILVYEDDGKCVRDLDIKELLNANIDQSKLHNTSIESGVYLNRGRYVVISNTTFPKGYPGKYVRVSSNRLLVVDTLCNILKDENLGHSKAFIHSYKGNLRLSKGLSNDTLVFYDDNLNELSEISFDYGNLGSPADQFSTGIDHRWNVETEKFMVFKLSAYLRSMPKVFSKGLQTGSDYKSCFLVWDKASNRMCAMPYNYEFMAHGFKNDIDGGAPFLPLSSVGNKMYQVLWASDFKKYAEKSTSKKMKEVAATLTDESNSVLVVATLK